MISRAYLVHSNQDLIWWVKIALYSCFWVDRGSCLLWLVNLCALVVNVGQHLFFFFCTSAGWLVVFFLHCGRSGGTRDFVEREPSKLKARVCSQLVKLVLRARALSLGAMSLFAPSSSFRIKHSGGRRSGLCCEGFHQEVMFTKWLVVYAVNESCGHVHSENFPCGGRRQAGRVLSVAR